MNPGYPVQKNPEIRRPRWRVAEKEFSSEAEAVAFVIAFWKHLGYIWMNSIESATTASELREISDLDRTVIFDTGHSFKVQVYRNHDKEPLTEKAIEFLISQGIQGVE